MTANPDPQAFLARSWDYIIVGGGTAGCVLANRLSANPDISVLVLEAGSEAKDPAVFAPGAWPGLAGGSHDWNYATVPQAGLLSRCLPQPRGKGLGGSTLINAMAFQRGTLSAYDHWAAVTGDPGWGAAGLLPYFRRLETASAGSSRWRGGDGPLQVLMLEPGPDHHPLSMAYAQAGVSAGFPLNADWNGERSEGTIWSQLSLANGRRATAAAAYVEPVRTRPNLRVVTDAHVQRLVLGGGACAGVELATGAKVRATRETILCAGAFDSPRLLMLSGIGDSAELAAAGIAPVRHLPGVGRNLADHPLVPGLLFRCRQPLVPSHYNHCETMVLARSTDHPGWADLQLMGLTVPFLSPELGQAPADCVSIVPALLAPRSRGSIRLAGPDPAAPCRIDPGYLADPRDVAALVEAFAIARDIAAQPALQPWLADEVFPGRSVQDPEALATYIRRTASPFFHPVGTCRMGRADDAAAVTDPACRVRGIARLRVVDASIMPSIPPAMTMAPVLALAERAADIIAGAARALSSAGE